jgi:hypothetical protein
MAAYNAGRTLKDTTVRSIPIPVPFKRTMRTTAPVFTTTEVNPIQTAQTMPSPPRKPLRCFLCGKEHRLFDCPTLTPTQKIFAQETNMRFLAKRRLARADPTYALGEVQEDLDIQEADMQELLDMTKEEEAENWNGLRTQRPPRSHTYLETSNPLTLTTYHSISFNVTGSRDNLDSPRSSYYPADRTTECL